MVLCKYIDSISHIFRKVHIKNAANLHLFAAFSVTSDNFVSRFFYGLFKGIDTYALIVRNFGVSRGVTYNSLAYTIDRFERFFYSSLAVGAHHAFDFDCCFHSLFLLFIFDFIFSFSVVFRVSYIEKIES